MEIEEEEELKNMNSYKLEFYKRRAKDKDKWKKSLEEEIERIKNKDKMVALYRKRENNRVEALQKV